MNRIISFSLFIVLSMILHQCNTSSETLKLWYDEPAKHFEQALPLGNGKVGAAVFGGIESEMIYLNDMTLWTGEPIDPDMNPEAHTYIPLIREALKNENYRAADSLNRFVQGSFSQSYAPLGSLFIDFNHEGEAKNYYRELNIEDATSKVEYNVNEVKYHREYFVSNADQLMLIKLDADEKEMLDFNLRFNSQLNHQVRVKDNVMEIYGQAPVHAEPSYRGEMADAIRNEEEKGTRFACLMKVRNFDGRIVQTDSSLHIQDGSHAEILVSIATSFNGFDKDPFKEGKDEKALASTKLSKVESTDYLELLNRHIQDHQSYFKRVSLDLGASDTKDLPTDERLLRYAQGGEDKYLERLYFQYGRYLLLSSSRTSGVPANLQGIWNPYMRPPWSSNYTVNINVEENYWLAETGNLSELHEPLLSFIENVSKTGAITARNFYGVGGWCVCHNSDIWAMSNPVGDFGNGHPVWANWNMGGTWLSTHLWEHYTFTQDLDFLSEKAYPLMKGAAQFCLEWLVEDRNGHLVTSPSTSPENMYVTSEGYVGATLYGATADLAMIRELFIQTIRASEILDTDPEYRAQLQSALDKLRPYQVGRKGNLQEWYYDWEDQDPHHRHQSHLFGLHPGNHITTDKTPELADACRKTLELRGDESTGWSKGWRINFWARLKDGNHAYKMYRSLLRLVDPSGLHEEYSHGGGTYPNLFDAHPPFQIDGNFGGAAGVIEMLVQSNEKEILILPALPDAWPDGSISGIRARGGFEVDVKWKDGKLEYAMVEALADKKCRLKYGDEVRVVELEKGKKGKVRF